MTTTTSARSVCARIAQRLAQSVGPRRYSMWFDRTAKFNYDDEHRRLDVSVPNRFVADWIGKNFGESLRHAVNHEVGEGDVDLRVEVKPDLFEPGAAGNAEAELPVETETASPHARREPAPLVRAGRVATSAASARAPQQAGGHRRTGSNKAHNGLEFLGDTAPVLRHQLDAFIAGPTNDLAFAAAVKLAEEPASSAHPLFIHGGCGLGKTHLLQGICARVFERNPQARVLYTTGEQFTNEFLVAMRTNRIEAFRKKIRGLDVLAVDDVHFLANKQATQQEFLHSFDAIELGGARVVLASDSHPKLIHQFSEALVSRCVRGMVVEIAMPDVATRGNIIRALAQRRGLTLMSSVAEALAARCAGSVREIEGMLAKLHALSSLHQQRRIAQGVGPGEAGGEPIGHTLVNQLFDGQTQAAPRRAIRFERVVEVVSEQLQVARAQIVDSGRQSRTVLARSLVAYLARQMTPMSYPEIAGALGRKNHSTIITAAQRLEKQLAENPAVILPATMEQVSLRDLIERLKRQIARDQA